jgi:hypothetical protein
VIDYGTETPFLWAASTVEVHLLEFFFNSGTRRYNTSSENLEWNGVTWFAGYGVFDIQFGAQTLDGDASGTTITLGAMDPTKLAQALIEKVKGKPVNIYHAILNPDTYQIVRVVKEEGGRMSSLTIMSGGSLGGA